MNENTGYQQGYYLALFVKFLWTLFIAAVFQFMIMYIFGVNFFTFWILGITISFFINTSFPIKDNYPYLRHGLILFCVVFINGYSIEYIERLNSFFAPNVLWITIMFISVLAGVITSFGKSGNGTLSNTIESFGNIILLILIILVFILYWWEGGVVYLIFRIPIIFFEIKIAHTLLYMADKSYNNEKTSPEGFEEDI